MEEKKKTVAEKTKIIRDFMVPFSDYPTIDQNATLEQAVNMMYRMAREKGYRWLVVVDDKGKITGFLWHGVQFPPAVQGHPGVPVELVGGKAGEGEE